MSPPFVCVCPSLTWFPPEVPASTTFMDHFRALEHTISRFASTLLPLHQLGAALPEDKYKLIMIHSLTHAAMIRLHFPFMESDSISREKCLRSARGMILVSKHIADMDFEFLDPLIGVRNSVIQHRSRPTDGSASLLSALLVFGCEGTRVGAAPSPVIMAADELAGNPGRTGGRPLRHDEAQHAVPVAQ